MKSKFSKNDLDLVLNLFERLQVDLDSYSLVEDSKDYFSPIGRCLTDRNNILVSVVNTTPVHRRMIGYHRKSHLLGRLFLLLCGGMGGE